MKKITKLVASAFGGFDDWWRPWDSGPWGGYPSYSYGGYPAYGSGAPYAPPPVPAAPAK